MQEWLFNIVKDFNRLIDTYAEPEYKEKWKVTVADGQVAFGSSKDKWGFNFGHGQEGRACRSRTSSTPTRRRARGAGQEAPAPRGAPRHGRQAPPAAPRGAGVPHPQDLAGRPQQRRGQVAAGLRRERPDGHDGHERRRRPGRGACGRRQALLRHRHQRRPGLPPQLEEGGQDPVGPAIHGLPEGDSRLAPGGQHPRAARASTSGPARRYRRSRTSSRSSRYTTSASRS